MSKNWAICIGIDDYYNLKSLKYAQRDAEAVRNFCLDEAGFERVYFFGEGAEPIQQDYGPSLRAEPTFGNLERFLDVRFREPFLEDGDNLWFFFAGHGRRYNRQDYLMPIDGNPGNVERTGLAISEIANRLRGCGADNVILMLDACRDEDNRDGGQGVGVQRQQGVVTLFACSPNELSYEIDELQQGAFTYALLEGLRIQGEGNCATVERLYQHLRYQVPALNERYQKRGQTPYVIAEPATKLHLILLPEKATLHDVQALKVDALEAEAERDWVLAEQLWIRVLVASSGDRQAVKALKRIGRESATQMPMRTSATPSVKPVTAGSRRIQLPNSETPEPQNFITPAPPDLTVEFEVVRVDRQGKITQRQKKHVMQRRDDLGNGAFLDLVQLPGGHFQMGSPPSEAGRDWYKDFDDSLYGIDVEHQHSVDINPFLMGKYPVTQAQWKAVSALPKITRDLQAEPSYFRGAQRPVEQVDWDDAIEFCQRLSKYNGQIYRLPSEAEWEYACRAETTTPFSFGKTLNSALANYDANYTYGKGAKGRVRAETEEVNSFPANDFGLHSMHGNVWEWCEDVWHISYDGAPNDGSAWVKEGESSLRLMRGGSWFIRPDYCRSAYRNRDARAFKGYVVGFRVVCDLRPFALSLFAM